MWLQMLCLGGTRFFSILEAKLLGFQTIQGLYNEDSDFREVLQGELKGAPYSIQEGYEFKGNKLSVPRGP